MRCYVIALCLVASMAFASEHVEFEGVNLPNQLQLDDKTDLRLQSYALRQNHGQKVYVASLYGQTPLKQYLQEKQLQAPMMMRFDIVAEKIEPYRAQNWWMNSVIVNNEDSVVEAHAEDIAQFKSAVQREFKAGDIVLLRYLPQNGVELVVNGQTLAQWRQKSFFELALNTWIGPYPPDRAFKRAILNFPTES